MLNLISARSADVFRKHPFLKFGGTWCWDAFGPDFVADTKALLHQALEQNGASRRMRST
jgi:hypothetical protein